MSVDFRHGWGFGRAGHDGWGWIGLEAFGEGRGWFCDGGHVVSLGFEEMGDQARSGERDSRRKLRSRDQILGGFIAATSFSQHPLVDHFYKIHSPNLTAMLQIHIQHRHFVNF